MGKKPGRKKKGEEVKNDNLPEAGKIIPDFSVDGVINSVKTDMMAQILLGLVIVAFILRFFNLGFNSLWLDEASTLTFATQSLSGIWEATASGEFNPPLFYYMEHFMLTFGDSEFVLRFLPALFGALTVPVIYLIGKVFTGKTGGIFAAALMTFSSFHIFYSQDARAYTIMLFFFSLAVLFYLWAINTDEMKWWLLFGVFSALAFWTHFYVFIGVGLIVLHALIVKGKDILADKKRIIPIAASVIAFIIVSLPLIMVTVGLFFKRTASAPTWGLSGMSVITDSFNMILGGNLFITVILLLLAVGGIYRIYTQNKSYALLLILSIFIPFIVSMILSAKIPMSPRYLIFVMPFLLVAIAGVTGFVPRNIEWKKVAAVAVVFALLINIPMLAGYYSGFTKNDWRGFSGKLSEITEDGDYIVVMPGYMRQPLDYYYSSTDDRTIEKLADNSETLKKISDEAGGKTTYYVLTGDIFAANPDGDAIQWLDNNAELMGQHTNIYIFKSKTG
jgi:uncharacterized membrane protein